MSQSSANEAPVRPGDVLAGKYQVERVLGMGGMGVVVAARHLQLDERVALKFLLPDAAKHPEVVSRFSREAKAAAKIRSEHVARVTDVGAMESGAPYLVMEYLEGTDLARHVEHRSSLPVAEALDYLLQACEAIAEAHALGIVHRDLKPSNLFLSRRADGSPCVKVLDFGISKMAEVGDGQASSHGLTKTSASLGSPLYMSPEQMTAAKTVDARTDVWALGVILFELLTGTQPFRGESLAHLYIVIATQPSASLRALRPDVHPQLEAVVMRCLEKQPAARFANTAELAKALAPFAPPQAATSIERILRTSGQRPEGPPPRDSVARTVALTGAPITGPVASAPLASNYAGASHFAPATAGTWASTDVPGVRPGRTIFAAVAAATVLVLFVVAGVVGYMRRGASPRAAESAGLAATPSSVVSIAAPEPKAAPPVLPSAQSPAPSASSVPPSKVSANVEPKANVPSTPGAMPVAAPRTSTPTPLPLPKEPAAPPTPPPPAPENANCNPNHYFDADGNKHFKPECFKKVRP